MLRITCQHASRLLSQQQDEPLPFGRRMRLAIHLAVCDACGNVARQFASVSLAMKRLRERE
jgi:Putative zinc-finger